MAKDQYAAAWQALPDNDTGAERSDFYFGRTVRLEGNFFPQYARRARGRSRDELRTGSILIDYSIDTKGRVTDSSVVESDPQGLMDESFLSIYRRSLFRPRYNDGVAQLSDGLLARHEFWYVSNKISADDDDDSDADSNAKAQQSRGKLSYPGDD